MRQASEQTINNALLHYFIKSLREGKKMKKKIADNVAGLGDRLPALALWVAATFAKPLLAEGTVKLRQN